MRCLVLVSLVAACGSQAAAPAPATPLRPPVAALGLPLGPPLVTPGEHMTYKLALQGVELAAFDLAVGDPAALGGKQAIVVQSHAKTVGIVKMVANIDDVFTSWIDVATGRPLRWTTDEYATRGTDKERTDASFAGRTGNSLPIEFHVNDEPPKSEPQTVALPDAWDFNSFLVALRVWSPPAGSSVVAEVLRSRFMWHVEMTVHGKEQVTTALGTLPAIRLDGRTYKLDRAGARDPDSDERSFSIWISDDDGRVPLQIVAKTDYGEMKMEITDYSPGSGQRLRR